MNQIPDSTPPDSCPPASRPEASEPAPPATGDSRAVAIDGDLGELLLLIGRIRRELDGGDPLHCPDMKPMARRVERLLGLLPQLPRADAQPLLPRLERVMAELDAVEARLRERKAVLDAALAPGQAPPPAAGPDAPPPEDRQQP